MVAGKNGEIAFHKPVVYQVKSGQVKSGQPTGESPSDREPVDGNFTLLAGNTVRFRLGSYDKSRAVVIDPTLAYSTYLGGSGGDFGGGIAVDASGSAYVTGSTGSTDFPVTEGAYQTVNSGGNAFITKLNSNGTALIYSTYLGGSGGAGGSGIAVDASGQAYVTGSAGSDFPVTKGAFQTVNNAAAIGGSNAFVTKLNTAGRALEYSTYLGGSGIIIVGDAGSGIAVDVSGHAYVTGTAFSTDFPTTKGAFQIVNNGAANSSSNAFVTKLNFDGTALHYSTYLGGDGVDSSPAPFYDSSGDSGIGIAVDVSGDAYVTGAAFSTDFPTTKGAFQTVNNARFQVASNAFVTKLNFDGTALHYSTYLGGGSYRGIMSPYDYGTGIAVDASGHAYVTGAAQSTNFPTAKGAFQTVNNAAAEVRPNAFVTELNFDGTGLHYSTYLGGSGNGFGGDSGGGIALDASGNVYVDGTAYSRNFPVTKGAFQTVNHGPTNSATNAFVAKFSF